MNDEARRAREFSSLVTSLQGCEVQPVAETVPDSLGSVSVDCTKVPSKPETEPTVSNKHTA